MMQMRKLGWFEFAIRDFILLVIWWPAAASMLMLWQWWGLMEYIGLPPLTWGQAFVVAMILGCISRPHASDYEAVKDAEADPPVSARAESRRS